MGDGQLFKLSMKRIIPRLDIKGPNLVKGIHLEGLRVLGSPEIFAQYYYENGADEIIFQDVVASLFERNSLHEIISRTAKNIFIPITVGGGIRTIEDIHGVLRAGADKVSLNTAVVRNPSFIEKAARMFGSSTIVVAIEAIKKKDGDYYVFTDNGREETTLEVASWAEQITALGAGEIVITSVDRDGTSLGYDIELIQKVKSATTISVVAHGGASDFENIKGAMEHADAIAIGSALHYHSYDKIQDKFNQESEGNISFLTSKKTFKKVKTFSIPTLKNYLADQKIIHRPV